MRSRLAGVFCVASRIRFVAQAMDPETEALVARVMADVYGDPASPAFPKPLPESEAGPSAGGQRRYLWVDAFGVLNYVTLARRAAAAGLVERFDIEPYSDFSAK